ncbi:MAG: hypothetical protein IJU57_05220, partial [Clostridia bacterium]|nr:hypothetical protein [Clostridia bacterium]
MKKKIFSLMLAALVMLQIVVLPLGAAETPTAQCTFTITEASGKAGETVKLSVSVVSTEGVMALGIEDNKQFNTDVLEFVQYSGTDTELNAKAQVATFDSVTGVLLFSSDTTVPADPIDGKLCDVEFKIKSDAAPGDYPVSFNFIAKGNGSVDLTTGVVQGKVTVRPTGAAEFTFGEVKGLPGDTVDVPLTVETTEYVSFLYLDTLTYDTTSLDFLGFFDADTGAAAGSVTGADGFDKDNGRIVVLFEEPKLLNGTLCTLRFTIKSSASAGDYDVTMNASSRYVEKTESTVTVGTATDFYIDDPVNITVSAPAGSWAYLFWTDPAFDSGILDFKGISPVMVSGNANDNVALSIDGTGSIDATAREVNLIYDSPRTIPATPAAAARVFTLRFTALADDDGSGTPVTMKLTAGIPADETTTSVTAGEIHVHNLTKVDAVAADCTHTGVTEAYWHCDGCDTDYGDEFATTEIDATARVIEALGHNWGEATYDWALDNTSVTATRTCTRDTSHTETETVNTSSDTTAATCTTGESTTYTAVFTNDGFTQQTKTVTGDSLGHIWGEATYVWSADNSKVTATRVCTRDSSHVETEEVDTTIGSSSATCTVAGTTTYTATFTNTAFTEQTKTITGTALGHSWGEPTYDWAADNSTVTATRTCTRDASHTETETVNTTSNTTDPTCTEAGETVYTATFENEGFTEQTKHVPIGATGHNMTEHPAVTETCTTAGNTAYWSCDQCNKFFSDALGNTEIEEDSWVIPAPGHTWGEPTYDWAADNSTVTATRICTTDNTHTETETVNTTSNTTDPTCTEAGETVYTATFENEGF